MPVHALSPGRGAQLPPSPCPCSKSILHHGCTGWLPAALNSLPLPPPCCTGGGRCVPGHQPQRASSLGGPDEGGAPKCCPAHTQRWVRLGSQRPGSIAQPLPACLGCCTRMAPSSSNAGAPDPPACPHDTSTASPQVPAPIAVRNLTQIVYLYLCVYYTKRAHLL